MSGLRLPRRRTRLLVAFAALAVSGPAALAHADLLPPASASVTICTVRAGASGAGSEIAVAADQVAAYLDQHPGASVGSCPSAPAGGATTTTGGSGSSPADTGGATVGSVASTASGTVAGSTGVSGTSVLSKAAQDVPASGVVTVCHVGASASTPAQEITVAVDKLDAFLNQHPGDFAGTCPGAPAAPAAPAGGGGGGGGAQVFNAGTPAAATSGAAVSRPAASAQSAATPSTIPAAGTTKLVVPAANGSRVTVTGAGASSAAMSGGSGQAVLRVTPKGPGILTVRVNGKTVKRIGVLPARASGSALTG